MLDCGFGGDDVCEVGFLFFLSFFFLYLFIIIINGEARGYMVPSLGLRQGDSLSPHLFLLCIEGLSMLIARKEQTGALSGIRIYKGASSIHHLLFADNSFLKYNFLLLKS